MMHYPDWLKIHLPSGNSYAGMEKLLKTHSLHTVCTEAGCPNIFECFSAKKLTFLILGKTCTRNCAYCGVAKGAPLPVDEDEPRRIAMLINTLGLNYIVITSVTRDDLPGRGADQFSRTIRAIKDARPCAKVEVLTPDFIGNPDAIDTVLAAKPFVFAHNIEVVEELFPQLRPRSSHAGSIRLLAKAKEHMDLTKSGIMAGLGETDEQLFRAFRQLRDAGVDILTIGQYLPPSKNAARVRKFYTPDEFAALKEQAEKMGFLSVIAGPLVRSSYHAEEAATKAMGLDHADIANNRFCLEKKFEV